MLFIFKKKHDFYQSWQKQLKQYTSESYYCIYLSVIGETHIYYFFLIPFFLHCFSCIMDIFIFFFFYILLPFQKFYPGLSYCLSCSRFCAIILYVQNVSLPYVFFPKLVISKCPYVKRIYRMDYILTKTC